MDVTGLMVKYYHTCHRELWFYANKIDVDRENVGIHHGSSVDDSSYEDSKRSVFVDGQIQLDVLDNGNIVEVKRSSSLEEPGEMQLKFYLWYLKTKKDIDVDGELAYPTERKRESIELTPEDELEMEQIVDSIQEIISKATPPEAERKPICGGCAYHDLCWV